MTSYVAASTPSGNGRRIKLLNTDIITGGIDNVFVYPTLDVDRLRDALSRTLSFWPIITGRIIVEDDQQYFIEFSDNTIPFTSTKNDELEKWPDLPIIVDDATLIQPFIDSVQYKPDVEPLLRIKVTHLTRSNEYVLGVSFFHVIGDADSNLHFLNDLSQIYQRLEPILPRPTFERHSLDKEDEQFTALPITKLYRNTDKRESILARLGKEHVESEPVNIQFSSEQILKLRQIIGEDTDITNHDALCAYIVLLINKNLYENEVDYIRRVYMYVNYRGVSDSIASKGYVANAILQPLSADFPDPLSLKSIATTIRGVINMTRKEEYLRKMVTSMNILMGEFLKKGHVNFVWDANEIVFNSNYKYDWTNQVNFGMVNQCRFHTMGIFRFYFRIFQLNPYKDDNGKWVKDNGGAEVSFRIPKGEMKERFLNAWKKDATETFANVK